MTTNDVFLQALEGSANEEHQEDELELLEGATVKPDWQVCAFKSQVLCMMLHSLANAALFAVLMEGACWPPDAWPKPAIKV